MSDSSEQLCPNLFPKKYQHSNVTKAVEYGKSLIGVPYQWWSRGAIPEKAPMFAVNGQVPPREEISTCNCAGFVNLMLRYAGKQLPYHQYTGTGGTHAYWHFYNHKGVLELFDINRAHEYPTGTLIMRKYRSITDQGHVAVLVNDETTNKQMVLHSITLLEFMNNSQQDREKNLGVNMKYTLEESHDGYYYDVIIRPENWLV